MDTAAGMTIFCQSGNIDLLGKYLEDKNLNKITISLVEWFDQGGQRTSFKTLPVDPTCIFYSKGLPPSNIMPFVRRSWTGGENQVKQHMGYIVQSMMASVSTIFKCTAANGFIYYLNFHPQYLNPDHHALPTLLSSKQGLYLHVKKRKIIKKTKTKKEAIIPTYGVANIGTNLLQICT